MCPVLGAVLITIFRDVFYLRGALSKIYLVLQPSCLGLVDLGARLHSIVAVRIAAQVV